MRGQSAKSKAAGAQSSASGPVFDEASCPQPDTWCRHAGATDQFMTCDGARVRVGVRAGLRVRVWVEGEGEGEGEDEG